MHTLLSVALLLTGCGTSPPPAQPSSPPPTQAIPTASPPLDVHFAQEDVLGTSMDLVVAIPSQVEAERVKAAIQHEILRRSKIIDTRDPSSEISKINAAPLRPGERITVSSSLGRLLSESLWLQRLTHGAFNAYAGDLLALWSHGTQPNPEQIDAVLPNLARGYHTVSRKKRRYLIRDKPGRFALDGIGKGYIIDKALSAARKAGPRLKALSIDIGGDLRVWGPRDWEVAIADPRAPEDNTPPLTRVRIRNLAIATSGTYARPLEVDGAELSHILDPRSGQPSHGVLQATVIAPSARRADALATALMVLGPEQGLALISDHTDAFALIVTDDGQLHRSRGFAVLELPREPTTLSTDAPAWPEGFGVTIDLQLVNSWSTDQPQQGKRRSFERHFLAAWVEDELGRPLRTLALWAKSKDIAYVRELDDFYKFGWLLSGGGEDAGPLKAISRASRRPGSYRLRWDGRDAHKRFVPQGTYTISVDVNRQHGPPSGRAHHTVARAQIVCGAEPNRVELPYQSELNHVVFTYGPRESR